MKTLNVELKEFYIENTNFFGTKQEEITEFFKDYSKINIADNYIIVEEYLFEPSIALSKQIIKSSEIENIDIVNFPLTLQIKNELIFISVELKSELIEFATNNNIPIVKRTNIWGKILEPFLDMKFDKKNLKPINILLAKWGLSYQLVTKIRKHVAMQILKYNFDTRLRLDCFFVADVLSAMRPKLNKKEFRLFYNKAMKIALVEG